MTYPFLNAVGLVLAKHPAKSKYIFQYPKDALEFNYVGTVALNYNYIHNCNTCDDDTFVWQLWRAHAKNDI